MGNLITFDVNVKEDQKGEEEFNSPDNTKWMIGVDLDGYVFIISVPNIHPSFFDDGHNCEDVGFSPDALDNMDAGIYECLVGFNYWNDGWGDCGYEFYIKDFKKLN